mmetsp:Transcript_39725/g.45606  ORF Transcript_39725/g.45606 Transcript_39725/m.45606 type:complete len:322 (-) Transcript_39725:25-990(-)|eukprot:CAMPEP_0168347522 /NCGR_PEP_ID=MMETSP0213-20121227/19062_1 /TAXON_ID=151035 /ORGANISM="Euplotes harpa, Strain FSP1.4" /LENGTH=321 /DNA_ID=CAMNT_0008356671 /DNA_START=441 /DNA_END=1406 /DNA_ORIENTATION=+
MTAQNVDSVDLSKCSEEEDKEHSFSRDQEEVKEHPDRRAKTEALKKLHKNVSASSKSSQENYSESADSRDRDLEGSSQDHKRVKLTEETEVCSKKIEEIKQPKEVFTEFSNKSHQEDDEEMLKRRKSTAKTQFKTPKNVAHRESRRLDRPQRTATSSSIQPADSSNPEEEYYDKISKLFLSKLRSAEREKSPLNSLLESNSQLLIRSLVIQDLFTNAFKRLIQVYKPTITRNLHNVLGTSSLILPARPSAPIRNTPQVARKSPDMMSSETIESDLHSGVVQKSKRPLITPQNPPPLSSFYRNTKGGPNTLSSGSAKNMKKL